MPVITSAESPRLTEARSEPKSCAMTQTRERSATVKHGVVPACSSCPGVISFSTTVPAIGERMMPSMREIGRPSWMSLMVCAVNIQRDERLQRGVAVGFGVGGVGFGLLCFALRDAVVLQQILVQVGKAAVGLGGGERLAIGADGRGKIGRIHRRQRIAFLDLVAEGNQQPRHRAGERRQHARGLIVVEIDRPGGLDRSCGIWTARRCKGGCSAAAPPSVSRCWPSPMAAVRCHAWASSRR